MYNDIVVVILVLWTSWEVISSYRLLIFTVFLNMIFIKLNLPYTSYPRSCWYSLPQNYYISRKCDLLPPSLLVDTLYRAVFLKNLHKFTLHDYVIILYFVRLKCLRVIEFNIGFLILYADCFMFVIIRRVN